MSDENRYVKIYEVRIYSQHGPTTLAASSDTPTHLTADEYAAWDASDASLIQDAVARAYSDGGYPCDGVVVFPRRIVRLADEGQADVPLDAAQKAHPDSDMV